jgi:Protein of unknown function (DUF3645)
VQWCSAVRKTRLAVPFHACDVPSERSEFKHADVALVKTVIAYDERGLDLDQNDEMLRALMDLEESQRLDIYRCASGFLPKCVRPSSSGNAYRMHSVKTPLFPRSCAHTMAMVG